MTHRHPILWLFTDATRGGDVLAAVRGLPAGPNNRGLCGVVFRHDGIPDRAELAQQVWRICRSREIAMVIAGASVGLAASGLHIRGSQAASIRVPRSRAGGLKTGSAHTVAQLTQARRAGISLLFLSPAFQTDSHPGQPALGPARFAQLSKGAGMAVCALGGVNGRTAMRLPPWVAGAGAIGALLPG
jgi:thiamine-phosphate pyrophosphorylase